MGTGLSLAVGTVVDQQDLARILRELRRREARRRGGSIRTYRELSEQTGWSRGVIGDYLTGKILPPTDRFDTLVRALGATAAELGPLATARDRVEERRRADTAQLPVPPPHELPAVTPGFVGRAAELAALDTLVAGGPGCPTGCVVSGPAGVGKTTLVVRWAHRVADRFGDGQLYLDLRGFDPGGSPMPPAEAIGRLLTAIGTPPEQVPPDLDDATRRYRSLLAGRRVLIVLDNARDADHVRPLLPGTNGTLALVTSRDRLTGLVVGQGVRAVPVALFRPGEARELLTRHLGADRLAAEPAATDGLVRGCAGLPLALSIVGSRAAAQPDFPLAAFAAQLGADPRQRLDALDTTDRRTQPRAVFSWSYRQLRPAAARLFRLLGLHPGTEFGLPAAASLAGDPPDRVRSELAELTHTHLLTEPSPGRYAVHDLLFAYARELAGDEPDGERHAARRRLLDHYLHTAHHARYQLHRQNPLDLPPPSPGAVPEEPAGPEAALAWFDLEHRTLLAAVELAAGTGADSHAWQLPWALVGYLDRRGMWGRAVSTLEVGLTAARRLGDRYGEALIRLSLGYHQLKRDDPPAAERQLEAALVLAGEAGDLAGEAMVHSGLHILRQRQGRRQAALVHAERALSLFQAAGHRSGEASAHNGLGWAYHQLGDFERGIGHGERALALLRRLDNRSIEANTWDTLGYGHRQLGRFGRAVDCYRRAADLHRECGDLRGEATALTRLGDSHLDAGDPAGAREAWLCAADLLRRLGHPDAELVRARLESPPRPAAPGRPPVPARPPAPA